MIAVLLADGFEEIEALTPVDVLRRAGLDVRTVAVGSKIAIGTHGISVICDMTKDEVKLSEVSAVVFPGGMPGALNLDASPFSSEIIDAVNKNGGIIAAICAAPLVLGRRGLLVGKRATCFPGFENELRGATVTKRSVTADGKIITANGMGAAMEFSIELVRAILGDEKANELARSHAPSFVRYTPSSASPAFPTSELLNGKEAVATDAIEEETNERAEEIITFFERFGAPVAIKGICRGPRITRFEIAPEGGVRVQKIIRLFDDLAITLGVEGMRMVAPGVGKTTVSLEIPNKTPSTVMLRELMETEEFKGEPSRTLVAIGKDVSGTPVYGDISKMPHLLVAGATGMGKSVCISSMLASMLYKSTPDELKLILIDPKSVEFTAYNGIPNLLVPVITDVKRAVGALAWALEEMERRYELMAKLEVRKLDSYNDAVKANSALGTPLPKIVIVIDELADLMMQARNTVEALIMYISQKARAAGIHLIIGTQCPTVSVLTGLVKANIPSRICFKVATRTDSKTVLTLSGAESLLNKGDMLYWPVGKSEPIRVQGAFISDAEVTKITEFLKSGVKDSPYDETLSAEMERAGEKYMKALKGSDDGDGEESIDSYLEDTQFLDAVDVAIKQGKISTSFIQRKLTIGYGKAAKFIDVMEEMGVISEFNGQKPRDVLLTRDEWADFLEKRKKD